MRSYASFTLVFMFFFAAPAIAGFYQWTDQDGRQFYTNELEKVPPEYRAQARSVDVRDDRVSVEQKPASSSKTRIAAAEHRDKYGRGEDYWRKRASNIRLKLRDLEEERDLVVKKIGDEEKKPAKSAASKKRTLAGLDKKKTKLERDIAKTRRLLEVDLPEEARRADAYPGWIRE